MSDQDLARPLLIHGEQLRLDITAPVGGGGDKFEPQSAAEARLALLPKIRAVAVRAREIPEELRGPRLYVEARLLPNYLAASHFPGALLAQVDAVPAGSRPESSLLRTRQKERHVTTRRLILAVTDEGLERLERLIDRPGPTRSEIQAYEEIRKLEDFGLREPSSLILSRPMPDDIATWEAVLHPSGERGPEPEPLDETTMEKWFALVESVGGEVFHDYVRTVGGLTFSPIRLPLVEAERVARLNPLRALRPMPTIRPVPMFGVRADRRFNPPASTAPRFGKPWVAIFDGGIDVAGGSGFFASPSIDLTPEPANPTLTPHGTAVGAAAMYGLSSPGGRANSPTLSVDHYRVLPPPPLPDDLDGYWVLDRIKETVSDQDYRLVNLSLGPSLAVEDSIEPNRWTCELDQLAWERDVVFVVATGNDGGQPPGTGLHRVQVPADMVNGLSIGACDLPPPEAPWGRAPYSSMGPGRHGNRIQPGGLQFGGAPGRPFPALAAGGGG